MIFSVFQKIGFLAILGPPYCGIGATIRIGREMLCLPYAGFFLFMYIFPPPPSNLFRPPSEKKTNLSSLLKERCMCVSMKNVQEVSAKYL